MGISRVHSVPMAVTWRLCPDHHGIARAATQHLSPKEAHPRGPRADGPFFIVLVAFPPTVSNTYGITNDPVFHALRITSPRPGGLFVVVPGAYSAQGAGT